MRLKRLNARRTLLGLLAGVLALGCGTESEPRSQLLIVVDTNVPTVAQAIGDPSLSRDSTLDTLRVDVLGDDGLVVDFLDVAAPDPADWPISFGVVPDSGSSTVRLRMRLFSGKFAVAGVLDGVPTLEPSPALTIDRVVEAGAPSKGVLQLRVLLDGDCLGIPPHFGSPLTTCVNAANVRVSPDELVESVDSVPPTEVGSWRGAREVACSGEAPSGARCVPGGFSIMGDAALLGVGDYLGAYPLRPVRLSPFFMDETEYTMGRYRAHVAEHGEPDEPPQPPTAGDALRSLCTLVESDDTSRDNYALSCLKWATARELCQAAGGDLPSEAQWEHAARGRGKSTAFPWGNEEPTCCSMSGSRTSLPGVPLECRSDDPLEPVEAHLPSAECGGIGDLSPDGIADLAGGLSELTRDIARDYDDVDCAPASGVPLDPQCDATGSLVVMRGGNLSAGLLTAHAALRNSSGMSNPAQMIGFRCVYPAVAP